MKAGPSVNTTIKRCIPRQKSRVVLIAIFEGLHRLADLVITAMDSALALTAPLEHSWALLHHRSVLHGWLHWLRNSPLHAGLEIAGRVFS
jgi:hypothetical protein